jgi:hypothetical protein
MRRSSNRPIIERLPYLAIRDIAKLIPRHNPDIQTNPDAYGWRYPGKVMLSRDSIRISDAAIVPQCFSAWIRTGFGKHRPLIICHCRRKAQILYFYQGRYACRHCHKATYLSERVSHLQGKLWQSARLRIALNGLPNEYALPRKPRGQHRKTYQRVTDQIAHLEAKARKARKREIDTRCIAYHLS